MTIGSENFSEWYLWFIIFVFRVSIPKVTLDEDKRRQRVCRGPLLPTRGEGDSVDEAENNRRFC